MPRSLSKQALLKLKNSNISFVKFFFISPLRIVNLSYMYYQIFESQTFLASFCKLQKSRYFIVVVLYSQVWFTFEVWPRSLTQVVVKISTKLLQHVQFCRTEPQESQKIRRVGRVKQISLFNLQYKYLPSLFSILISLIFLSKYIVL